MPAPNTASPAELNNGIRQAHNENPADAQDQLQLVSFEVGDEQFAIEILAVQEIIRMMPITRVPQSPPMVEGVINLRGQVTPVLDLRKRFALPPLERGQDARIMVVEVASQVLGFIVDKVNEVLRISASVMKPAPALTSAADSDYISGVGELDDRLLILLDLHRLFAATNLASLDKAA